ncbi:hypothetical protein QUF74_09780 [Candidatus Halobeggiatoa sp. HSG11]|nr:hypothetical protein [Candidatus Halobeggiatoa sp. HSG11]
MWQQRIFNLLLFFCIITLLAIVLLVYVEHNETNQTENEARHLIQQELSIAVRKINNELRNLYSVANSLAQELSSGELQRSAINARLTEIMAITPYLSGIGVAYIPYVNTPQERRQSPYYLSKESNGTLIQPFTIPCALVNNISKCVIFIEYSLENIQKLPTLKNLGKRISLLSTDNLAKIGHQFIISKHGDIITYPISNNINANKNIFEMAQNDKILKELAKSAVHNKSGFVEYFNKTIGQNLWIFYQPIPTTEWSMFTVLLKDSFIDPTASWRLWIDLGIITFLVFLFSLILRVDTGNGFDLWVASFVTSLLFLVSLYVVWDFIETSPVISNKNPEQTIIVSPENLDSYFDYASVDKLTPIPTEVVIEYLEFNENDAINIAGYVKQQYKSEIHNDIVRGFTLPQATFTKIKIIDHYLTDQTETIRWSFTAYIPQEFDYYHYPLDRRMINLLVKHADENAIVTPNFYPNMNPSSHPGVEQLSFLRDWNVHSSFFNYQNNKNPDFYLTIVLQRDLLNPFVYHILPLIVVLVMLFTISLLMGQIETYFNVIPPLTALFIGTVLSHIGLRQNISMWVILYGEYFYVFTYTAILSVLINFYLFDNHKEFKALQYKKGLVSKILFFPIVLGEILSIMLWMFIF